MLYDMYYAYEFDSFENDLHDLKEQSIAIDNAIALSDYVDKYGIDEKITALVGEENLFETIKNLFIKFCHFVANCFKTIYRLICKAVKWFKQLFAKLFGKKKLPHIDDPKSIPPNANLSSKRKPQIDLQKAYKDYTNIKTKYPEISGMVNLPFNITVLEKENYLYSNISDAQIGIFSHISRGKNDDYHKHDIAFDQKYHKNKLDKAEQLLKNDTNGYYNELPSKVEKFYSSEVDTLEDSIATLDTFEGVMGHYEATMNQIGEIEENPSPERMKSIVLAISDFSNNIIKEMGGRQKRGMNGITLRFPLQDAYPEFFKNGEGEHNFDTTREFHGEQSDVTEFKKFMAHVKNVMDYLRVMLPLEVRKCNLLTYECKTMYNAYMKCSKTPMTEFYHETFPLPGGMEELLKKHFDLLNFRKVMAPRNDKIQNALQKVKSAKKQRRTDIVWKTIC